MFISLGFKRLEFSGYVFREIILQIHNRWLLSLSGLWLINNLIILTFISG